MLMQVSNVIGPGVLAASVLSIRNVTYLDVATGLFGYYMSQTLEEITGVRPALLSLPASIGVSCGDCRALCPSAAFTASMKSDQSQEFPSGRRSCVQNRRPGDVPPERLDVWYSYQGESLLAISFDERGKCTVISLRLLSFCGSSRTTASWRLWPLHCTPTTEPSGMWQPSALPQLDACTRAARTTAPSPSWFCQPLLPQVLFIIYKMDFSETPCRVQVLQSLKKLILSWAVKLEEIKHSLLDVRRSFLQEESGSQSQRCNVN